MGRKNKIRMPSSEGGIVRYFDDEYKSKIVIRPEIIVGIIIAMVIVFTVINLM